MQQNNPLTLGYIPCAVEVVRPGEAHEEEEQEVVKRDNLRPAEDQGEEEQEAVERDNSQQPQYRGWDYEVDPRRYARSPAPTPEHESEPEQDPQKSTRFVTRSGRQWSLVSSSANKYEDELNTYLG